MKRFDLPDLGEGLQEAELIAWHVAEGERVIKDQPLASVETDKAVVEIPAPQTARIAKLFATPGDIIKVGDCLVTFDEDEKPDSGTVVGQMPATAPHTAGEPPDSAEGGRASASPAVRNLAKRLGVSLSQIGGTGPGGTISLDDVEKAAAGAGSAPLAMEPLRGVRRAMALKMTEAHKEIVPATVNDRADIGSWPEGEDVTFRLIRAIISGVTASPALNAWYLGPQKGWIRHEHIDLGVAMDTEDGLFVPVLRNVAKRSREDLRNGIEAMKSDIRNRSVPLEELRGQTITLSNFGMLGGQHAALVILPPQVAIIGAGRIHNAAVAGPKGAKVSTVLPLSITFDHRLVTGSEAARFLSAMLEDLEKPV